MELCSRQGSKGTRERENAGKPLLMERLFSLWAPGFVMDTGKGQGVMERSLYPAWERQGRYSGRGRTEGFTPKVDCLPGLEA